MSDYGNFKWAGWMARVGMFTTLFVVPAAIVAAIGWLLIAFIKGCQG